MTTFKDVLEMVLQRHLTGEGRRHVSWSARLVTKGVWARHGSVAVASVDGCRSSGEAEYRLLCEVRHRANAREVLDGPSGTPLWWLSDYFRHSDWTPDRPVPWDVPATPFEG